MNKFLFFLLFIAVSLSYLFELDKLIVRNFNPFNAIKEFYIEKSVSIYTTTQKYFDQVREIENLQNRNKELENYKLLYESTSNKLDSILETVNYNPNSTTSQVRFAQVLSYIDFDDFTKVWLDLDKKDNTILGLISDDYAAGIVVNQDGKAKALLNGNDKCNYAIFVGKYKAPGIIHPSKSKHTLIAKYIPIWYKINVGDEVITSGMDDIFFEGLRVGKVVRINKHQDMQEAIIEPYAKALKQKSFFVYTPSKKIEKKEPLSTITKDSK